jgi:hypothetical protein
MYTDQNIELKNRLFPCTVIKPACDLAYGREIAKNPWSNWREWAGVKKGDRFYRFDQFCFLYAIAKIRSDPKNRRRQLFRSEVESIKNSLETQELLAEYILYLDNTECIAGSDAIAALTNRGYNVSRATLYRRIPRFSYNRMYFVSDLIRAVSA